MRLLFYAFLCVAFFGSSAAAIVAMEAYRLSDQRAFRNALLWAVPFTVLTMGLIVFGTANQLYLFIPSDHPGFGDGWHCLWGSGKGSGVCIKDTSTKNP